MKEVTLRGVGVITVMKIAAVLSAIYGLILGTIWTIISLTGGGPEMVPFGAWAVLVMPVIYGLVGALGGLIISVLYNLFAGWIGGLKLVISSSDETTDAHG